MDVLNTQQLIDHFRFTLKCSTVPEIVWKIVKSVNLLIGDVYNLVKNRVIDKDRDGKISCSEFQETVGKEEEIF